LRLLPQALLGFIGTTDQTCILAEKLAFGPEARETSISVAKTKLVEAFGAVLEVVA
jgi:FMN-dependent NADH-azoreductase